MEGSAIKVSYPRNKNMHLSRALPTRSHKCAGLWFQALPQSFVGFIRVVIKRYPSFSCVSRAGCFAPLKIQ